MLRRQTTHREVSHPALEALEDGVCTLDADWRVTYWNAAAERMLRIPRARVLGRVLWRTYPFLRHSASWEVLRRVKAEGVPRRYYEGLPKRTGRGVASAYAAPLPEGGLVIHFRDATEEVKRAEHYTTLLESIRDGFIAVDDGWNILYLNAVAESLLRFSRDSALGLGLWSLLPEEPPEIAECLRATMRDGMQRHLRAVRPQGRVFRGRVFDLWTYPLSGGGISLLFEDVSDRVQREKELARLATEANDANEAKSRFFAAISHELRTPLNAIVGYTHLLGTATYGDMPAGARRAAERAGVCAEHLARLVDDVLLLTTAEIDRLPVVASPLVLQDFLPAVVEPHRYQAEAKGLALSLTVDPSIPRLETDPQRLRQLLSALLSNAVKFTSRGEVRVESVLRDSDTGRTVNVPPPSAPTDPYVEIVVTDTGPGVPAADRERIFGPFEQVGDPSRSQSMARGSGLGLTVARKLAHLLGGALYLAESSGTGSRFCLRVPLSYSETRS